MELLLQLITTLWNQRTSLENNNQPFHLHLHNVQDMDSVLDNNPTSSPSLILSEILLDNSSKIINVLKSILLMLTSNQRSNDDNIKIIINLLKQKPNCLPKPLKRSSKHNNYLRPKSYSSTPWSTKHPQQKRTSPPKQAKKSTPNTPKNKSPPKRI